MANQVDEFLKKEKDLSPIERLEIEIQYKQNLINKYESLDRIINDNFALYTVPVDYPVHTPVPGADMDKLEILPLNWVFSIITEEGVNKHIPDHRYANKHVSKTYTFDIWDEFNEFRAKVTEKAKVLKQQIENECHYI